MRNEMEFVLKHRILRRKVRPLHCVDFAVILLNSLCGDDSDDILCAAIEDIGAEWQRKSFVSSVSFAKQRFVTRALLLLIRVMV